MASLATIRAAREKETDATRRRADDFLELYFASEHLAAATSSLGDQIANLEGAATFSFDGKDLPYRNLEQLLANESNHGRRLAMGEASLPVVAQLNPLLQEKEARSEKLASELGFGGYNGLSARLRDVDLDALASEAERLLTDTDKLYADAMGAAVHRELGLDLKDMRRADIPRFFHAVAVQSAFPADQLLPRLDSLLSGMGLELSHLPGVTIDGRALPNKNPRAVCFPIEVPTDVRLSIKPQGGVDDYLQLYHEAGHALHFANTTTSLWELQVLGNNVVTEAYAFLIEDRLEDPAYLAELGLSGELLAHYVRSAAVKKLYMLRRYAAKVLFEKAWHSGETNPRAQYATFLARAYGFPVPEDESQRYLLDHDDFFYSADYLRAWFLAAQLDAALATRFGPTWWHKPEAGTLLKSLWAQGTAPSAEAIAKSLGSPGLETQPLLDRLQARLATKK